MSKFSERCFLVTLQITLLGLSTQLVLVRSVSANPCTQITVEAEIPRLIGSKNEQQQSLATLKDCGISALPNLIQVVGDPRESEKIRLAVIVALKEIAQTRGAATTKSVAALTSILDNPYELDSIQLKSIQALEELGSLSLRSIPTLITVLNDQRRSEKIRVVTAEVLIKLDTTDTTVITTLVELVKHSNELWEVRTDVVEVLGETGANGQNAIPSLTEVLRSTDWRSQEEAWIFQKAVVSSLVMLAGDMQDEAKSIPDNDLQKSISNLESALNSVENLRLILSSQNNLPKFVEVNAEAGITEKITFIRRSLNTLKLEMENRRNRPIVLVKDNYGVLLSVFTTLGLLFLHVTLLWLRPLWILKIDEFLEPLELNLPLFGLKLSARALILLKYHSRVLDAWVDQRIRMAKEEFNERKTVQERHIHISMPVELNGKILDELTAKDFKKIFGKPQGRLLIFGEGGSGKTSLACQIAKWSMADHIDQRLCLHKMLPVFLEDELETVEGPQLLIDAIAGRLRTLTTEAKSIPIELVKRLLEKRRILVIVDHLSEMSQATQKRIRPDLPDFPANALIVTSRVEENLGKEAKSTLKILRIEGDRLSKFMDAYLERLGKRELFTDEEYFNACRRLSRMVGQRNITILLARLYVDQMIAAQEGVEDILPDNIPDLMLSYLNKLNRNVELENRQDDLAVHRDSKIIAWECLKQTYRPASAKKDSILQELSFIAPNDDVKKRFEYLEKRLFAVHTVEPGDKVRISLDPLAEYLAALHLLDYCYSSNNIEDSWRKFLVSIDRIQENHQVSPASMRDFLLAVRECCIVKYYEAHVPDFVVEELISKAGLDPKELRLAQQKHRIQVLISELSAPEPEFRIRAAQDLGRFGSEARIASNKLLGVLENLNEENTIRQAAAVALGSIGSGAEALIKILEDRNEAVALRCSAIQALERIGIGHQNLFSILSENSENLRVRQEATKVFNRIDGEVNGLTPILVIQIQEGVETADISMISTCKVEIGEGVAMEMINIPAGTFLMGSPESEEMRDDDESPQHFVNVKSFWMSRFSISQAQWQAVVSLPRFTRDLESEPFHNKGLDKPAEEVSWFDAEEFCARLSQKTGYKYRLPSEAEWEYACRGGTMTPFHFGETISTNLANYNGNSCYKFGSKGEYRNHSTAVDNFGIANAFGLSDMHGNVFEWCADYWHDNYEDAPSDGSAWLVDGNTHQRVARGGSWYSMADKCRSACRGSFNPNSRFSRIGFRVVCSDLN